MTMTFEKIRDAVEYATSGKQKFSTKFFDGYCDAANHDGKITKILSLKQCEELAEMSHYTVEEIKHFFWNGSNK